MPSPPQKRFLQASRPKPRLMSCTDTPPTTAPTPLESIDQLKILPTSGPQVIKDPPRKFDQTLHGGFFRFPSSYLAFLALGTIWSRSRRGSRRSETSDEKQMTLSLDGKPEAPV